MKNIERSNFPKDIRGQVAGFVFLALIPLVVLVPITPVPAWLTQDLVLRWTDLLVFSMGLSTFAFKSKEHSLKLDFIDLAGLALAGWVLLSVKNSKEAFESFYALRSFLAMLFWWFSLRILWNRWAGLYPAFEKVLFVTTLLASGWLAFTTLGHHFVPYLHDRLIPRIGFFPNENIAAGLIGMVLIWALLKKLHGGGVSLWWLFVLLLGWCLTQSRGAFLAMAVVVVVYCVIHMKSIERRLSLWTSGQWMLAVGVVVAVAAVLSPMVNRVFNALETDPDAYKRFDLWVSILNMVTAQPWWGFGPGTFHDVYPAFQPSSLWDKMVNFTHDEYLQVAVECGIPAMMLTLVFIGSIFFETGKDLRKTEVFKSNSPALEAAETAFFLLLFESIHNLVDFTFHEWSHRLVLFAFITFALGQRSIAGDIQAELRFSGRAYFSAMGLLVFFVLWTLGLGGYWDYQSRLLDFRAILALKQGDLDQAEVLNRKSIEYRSNNMIPWNSLGAIEEGRAGWSKTPREKETHFRAADAYFRRAIELSPYSLTPVENEVRDLTERNKMPQALDLQAQIVQRAPSFPTGYLKLGLLQLKMGKVPNALLSAEAALGIAPYLFEAHALKAQALEAAGQGKEAVAEYQFLKNWKLSPDVAKQVESNIQRLQKKFPDASKR